MADPYTFTFDVDAFLSGQEVEKETPPEGVMKRPAKEAEAKSDTPTESLMTRLATALKSTFPDSPALGATPQGDNSSGRNKALTDWTISTEAFIPKYRGDVPAAMALQASPVTTTDMGPDMGTLAMQDAQEQSAIRSVTGITESLGRTALPKGTDAPSINPVVGSGREPTRDEIKSIQKRLKKGYYYEGAVDGVLGPDTTEALRSFQIGVNLRADKVRDETRDSFRGTIGDVGYYDSSQNINLNAEGVLDADTARYFDVDLTDSIKDVTLPSTDSVSDMYPTQGLMSPPVQDTVTEVDTDTANKPMPAPFVYDEDEQQAFETRKETLTNLGSSFDAASRDDIRVLQKTLRDMEGPTNVDVGGIDGRWGTKGRNALWAFQLRAGISPTGEMDEATAEALNSPSDYLDPRSSAVDASTLDTPASKMLVGVEALKLMPYELNSSRQGRSGLTFGAGIDVGQHTAARLKRDFNFTDDMIEEFGVYNAETNPSGWIGRNPAHPSKGGQGGNKGTTTRNRVHAEMATEYRRQREAGELPVVSEKWITENVRPVYDLYVAKPKGSYNNLYGSGAWDDLPEEAQAIAVLENYRGDGVNNAQMRLLNEGNYIGAARAATKSSRAPAMIKILNSYGHQ